MLAQRLGAALERIRAHDYASALRSVVATHYACTIGAAWLRALSRGGCRGIAMMAATAALGVALVTAVLTYPSLRAWAPALACAWVAAAAALGEHAATAFAQMLEDARAAARLHGAAILAVEAEAAAVGTADGGGGLLHSTAGALFLADVGASLTRELGALEPLATAAASLRAALWETPLLSLGAPHAAAPMQLLPPQQGAEGPTEAAASAAAAGDSATEPPLAPRTSLDQIKLDGLCALHALLVRQGRCISDVQMPRALAAQRRLRHKQLGLLYDETCRPVRLSLAHLLAVDVDRARIVRVRVVHASREEEAEDADVEVPPRAADEEGGGDDEEAQTDPGNVN